MKLNWLTEMKRYIWYALPLATLLAAFTLPGEAAADTRYPDLETNIGVVPAVYGAEQPTGSGHSDSGHSESGHSHLAVFLGAGEEDIGGHQESAKAIGIIDEYRFRSGWDVGAALERLEVGGHANTIALIPAGYHFSNGLRLFAAPGHLFASGSAKDKWLFRAGISYEIHISERWTMAPEVFKDFLEGGGDAWIAGVAIGYGF